MERRQTLLEPWLKTVFLDPLGRRQEGGKRSISSCATTQGMQRPNPVRVLLVEDEVADARLAHRGLPEAAGFLVHHVRTGRDALEAARTGGFHIVLLDQRLPDVSGVELGKRLRQRGFKGSLVMLSGVHQDELVDQAFAAGIEDFVVKDLPYGDRLSDTVQAVLQA